VIWNLHTEVLLADGYALLLVAVAVILEFVARHSHHRSERYRHAGFVYKPALDVWECPTGHHLKREKTDFERNITHYRAPAHKCNACAFKKYCTDSEEGRLLQSRPDSWLQSELSRFHRVISLALLLLAFILLVVEMLRYRQWNDWIALLIFLLPISLAGSRYLVAFGERTAKANPESATTVDVFSK
jgi:hypothetical protein